jgi:hypothetical protein
VDELIKRVEKESRAFRLLFNTEELVALNPAGLTADMEPDMRNHGEVQGKLSRHWQLLGLQKLAEETEHYCDFLYHFAGESMRPTSATVVPHLLPVNEGLTTT